MKVLGILLAACLAIPMGAAAFPTAVDENREIEPEDLETVVYFDYGSEELGSAGLRLVRETADLAIANGFSKATVVGHADRAGPKAQNLETGMARAEAVALVLIASGFDADNVDVESAGEEDPAVFYEDERREPRNRRAVITFER